MMTADPALKIYDRWRWTVLMAGLAVYALFGRPAPPVFGWPEMVVTVALVVFICPLCGLHSLRCAVSGSWWHKAGLFLLLYGLSVPLVVAAVSGHDGVAILRDVIPFLFMMIPLLAAYRCGGAADEAYRARLLTAAMVTIGLVFSGRVLLSGFAGGTGFLVADIADPALLANVPGVLLAACLLLFGAYARLYARGGYRQLWVALPMMALALLPLCAMVLVMQRAGPGYMAVAALFLIGLALWHAPCRAFLPLVLAGLTVMIGAPLWLALADTMMQKTLTVGLNMRLEEALAVFDRIADRPLTVLFGAGWGALYVSPAVGGADVGFTHNIASFYFLKTGLIGLAALGVYLGGIGIMIVRLLARDAVLAVSLGGAVLICVLLYASFKSLDFGLLLLLVTLWASRYGILQATPGCSMQKEFPAMPDRT